MELQKHSRKAQLSQKEHKTWFVLCCAPMCSFCCEPKGVWCPSHVMEHWSWKKHLNSGLKPKHINIKYWQFIEHVKQHNIEILPVDTNDQLADIFMKPLPTDMFEKLRNGIQGIDWKGMYYSPQTMECGDSTSMGFGQLFIPWYIWTDSNWEFKILFRQHWKVSHCSLAPGNQRLT